MVGDQVHDMYEHEDLEMFYLNHYSLHLPRENILCETDEDWDESFERSDGDSGNQPNQTFYSGNQPNQTFYLFSRIPWKSFQKTVTCLIYNGTLKAMLDPE